MQRKNGIMTAVNAEWVFQVLESNRKVQQGFSRKSNWLFFFCYPSFCGNHVWDHSGHEPVRPALRKFWTGNEAGWQVNFRYWPSGYLSRVIDKFIYLCTLLGKTQSCFGWGIIIISPRSSTSQDVSRLSPEFKQKVLLLYVQSCRLFKLMHAL